MQIGVIYFNSVSQTEKNNTIAKFLWQNRDQKILFISIEKTPFVYLNPNQNHFVVTDITTDSEWTDLENVIFKNYMLGKIILIDSPLTLFKKTKHFDTLHERLFKLALTLKKNIYFDKSF